jgi:hypothetical protein
VSAENPLDAMKRLGALVVELEQFRRQPPAVEAQ